MHRVRSVLILLAATLLLAPAATARGMTEEIDHLLAFITASPCAFIRNGVPYEGKAAVDHIRDKYEHYRDDIHSAEDFIARAATKSETSGKPYLVKCDADTMPAAEWLKKELATFRQLP